MKVGDHKLKIYMKEDWLCKSKAALRVIVCFWVDTSGVSIVGVELHHPLMSGCLYLEEQEHWVLELVQKVVWSGKVCIRSWPGYPHLGCCG